MGAQRVNPALCVWPDIDQSYVAQHAQVARDGGLGQPGQCRHEISGSPFAARQRVEQDSPAWLGNGLESIHTQSIAFHLYR
ncbi:Uncharacterised protein [Mycobacteroides abscessus subsp. massiliense]|nr:Uncharacterised protein [Mycobacteroides abscessus subsp. massiliense]